MRLRVVALVTNGQAASLFGALRANQPRIMKLFCSEEVGSSNFYGTARAV